MSSGDRDDDASYGITNSHREPEMRKGSNAQIVADSQNQWNNQYKTSSSNSSSSSGQIGTVLVGLEIIGIFGIAIYYLWAPLGPLATLFIAGALAMGYRQLFIWMPRGPIYTTYMWGTTILWFCLGAGLVDFVCWSFDLKPSGIACLIFGGLLAVGNYQEKRDQE